MEVFDFLSSAGDDLFFEDGDFAFGESTEQHQRDLLLADKGSIRQFPMVGVGIIRELMNDANADDIRRIIQQELERDGMNVESISVQGDTFNISASYAKA